MWQTFFAGALLCVESNENLLPGDPILKTLSSYQVTHVTLPPPLLSATPFTKLPFLEVLVSAGSACTIDIMKKWMPTLKKFFANAHGPTEYSVCDTIAVIKPSEVESLSDISIGTPNANTEIAVLDDHQQHVAPGTPGELCLSGLGTMLGYFDDPVLTAQALFQHAGKTFYRTGDTVKHLLSDDGEILGLKYVGRQGGYLKIAGGYRVDPNEIASQIKKIEGVADAFVISTVDRQGLTQLVVYVSLTKPHQESQSDDLSSSGYWTKSFDALYKSIPLNTAFNTAGWINSFTGENIPDEEMSQWASLAFDRAFQGVFDTEELSVFDNGCGTGAFYNLCNQRLQRTFSYFGLDLSEELIHSHNRHLGSEDHATSSRGKTQFSHGSASNYESYPTTKADVVILNSVIQYYSNVQTLCQVLENSLRVTNDGGRIFIGDVRCLELQDILHCESALHKKFIDALTKEQLFALVKYNKDIDKELVLSMRFFERFAQEHPDITGLEFHLKTGPNNELTYYRYDVVFHVRNPAVKIMNAPTRLTWDVEIDAESLETNCFANESIEQFCISGIPNDHLPPIDRIDANTETVAEMKRQYDVFPHAQRGNLIRSLYELARTHYCKIQTRMSLDNPQTFDVIGMRSRDNAPCCIRPTADSTTKNLNQYANNPLFALQILVFPDEARKRLQETLPPYLIPSAILALPELPTTVRGKVDTKLLPPPFYHISSFEVFVPPTTETEKRIASIWRDILVLDPATQISTNHDFFRNLGGNSMLVFRVIRQINEAFHIELETKEFIDHSTVSLLSEKIEEKLSLNKCTKIDDIDNSAQQSVTGELHAALSLL